MSVRMCRNCKKENEHSINCHVISEKLEQLRAGIIRDDGGKQYLELNHKKISGFKGLIESRVKRGTFWCDQCEKTIGGIDNEFVPLIKKMIQDHKNKIKNNFDEFTKIGSEHPHFELLYKGVNSIILRKELYNKKQSDEINLHLPNYIKIKFEYLKVYGFINFFTRVDTEQRICVEQKMLEINFDNGHRLLIQLIN